MLPDLTHRWRKAVRLHVFIDEIQDRLLFLREHARRYTVHTFGMSTVIEVALSPLYGRGQGAPVQQNRGVALILALLVLSFLTILGGALLTTSTIDIWISDNYKTYTQALYV